MDDDETAYVLDPDGRDTTIQVGRHPDANFTIRLVEADHLGPTGPTRRPPPRPAAIRPDLRTRAGRSRRRVTALDEPVTVVALDVGVSQRPNTWRRWRGEPGRALVAGASLTFRHGEIIAVVGPSGAGKTTLVRALTGQRTFSGQVTFNGHSVDDPDEDDLVRRQVGVVPQAEVLHGSLTLEQALTFAARLRLAGTTEPQRRHVVDSLLADLGFADAQRGTQLARLSGGERKRVSVGLELMTRSPVLVLDEPTTGLDPDGERRVVNLLRDLAHEGRRTVIVITHSLDVIASCDRVVVIAKSSPAPWDRRAGTRRPPHEGPGRIVYDGTPRQAAAYFGVGDDWAQIYEKVKDQNVDWAARFRHSETARDRDASPGPAGGPRRPLPAGTPWIGGIAQTRSLLRRAVAVKAGNRHQFVLLLLQGPLLALLLSPVVGRAALDATSPRPRVLVTYLVFAATLLGLVNAHREIVSEADLVSREKTVGLSAGAYVSSKLVLLFLLGLSQAVVLTGLYLWQTHRGRVPGLPVPEGLALALALLLLVTAASAGGLFLSALSRSTEFATVAVPVVIITQLIFMGALKRVDTVPVLQQAAEATPSYWGYVLLADVTDLGATDADCRSADAGHPGPDSTCLPRWHRTGAHVVEATLALGFQAGAYLTAAYVIIRRRRPEL